MSFPLMSSILIVEPHIKAKATLLQEWPSKPFIQNYLKAILKL